MARRNFRRVCKQCGIAFRKAAHHARPPVFCSKFCAAKFMGHSRWKGDAACPSKKRARAARLIPVLGPCEQCGGKAHDRHHIDGNPGNNELANIAVLCRRCHMKADGRYETFIQVHRGTGPLCRCGARNTVRVGESALTRQCQACGQTYRYVVRDGLMVPLALETWAAMVEVKP